MNEEMYLDSVEKIIEEFAMCTRKHFDLQGPLNLDLIKKMIDNLGGTLEEDDSLDCDATLSLHKGTKKFDIRYYPNAQTARKLVAVAHELGHLFLHAEKDENNNFTSDRVYQRSPFVFLEEEMEANMFASSFLMPENLFKEFCEHAAQSNHSREIELKDIATHFGVSVKDVDNRGEMLNLW